MSNIIKHIVLVVVITVLNQSIQAEEILFVVLEGTANSLFPGDQSVFDRLENDLGHTVTTIDELRARTNDAFGMDLVVVSSTILSSNVGIEFTDQNPRFSGLQIPTIHWENNLNDEYLISSPGSGFGQQDSIEITLDGAAHPMAAGLTPGQWTVKTVPTFYDVQSYNNLAPDAIVVAEDSFGEPAITIVEAGDELNDGTLASAHRISLFLGNDGVADMTDEGLDLFDAAIDFAIGRSDEEGPAMIPGQDGIYAQDFDSMNVRRGRIMPQGWLGVTAVAPINRINALGLRNADAAMVPGIVNVGGTAERFSPSSDGVVGTWNSDVNGDGAFDDSDVVADSATDRALGIARVRSEDSGALVFHSVITDEPLQAVELEWDLEVWGGDPKSAFRGKDGAGFALEVIVNGTTYGGQSAAWMPGEKFATRADEQDPERNTNLIDGNLHAVRSIQLGPIAIREEDGAVGNELRIVFDADHADADGGWIAAVDNLVVRTLASGAARLQAGDADQDHDFDQLDLVQVQIANKYLTGHAATWGEGDWNGAPDGSPGSPPAGDGVFNQMDIIAANLAGVYLQGPYAALQMGGVKGDGQTSLVYSADTGELSVDAPKGQELTSINVASATGMFVGRKPAILDGAFDNFVADNVFKATFGGSFGSISFGNVLPPGIAESDLAADLSVVGSLSGGADFGEIDLVYVPEPASASLLIVGLAIFASSLCAQYGLRNCSRSGHAFGHKP